MGHELMDLWHSDLMPKCDFDLIDMSQPIGVILDQN